ncbi:UPF0158 family protein [Phytohabitans houttuyneae]|uniref:Uncharacterized protein n=1 Tax=Phytohabitans houttuyneae TaxID=1076126 RepID=A0A6V8KAD4_9ACTN|nr:UPF0158 family protein [Phytohabitans houttuyneae]GFJ79119.1 hypothetical protein Phou_032990 [Phytohabitans houttuyneae]
MLDLSSFDLEELAAALADQDSYDRRWLVDSRTGEIVYWTTDCGIDGQNPIDLDELDEALIAVDPLPSRVWYRDMADFARGISDDQAQRRLERAINGRGSFRRFRDELHREYPDLVSVWNAFRDARARQRAVQWLADHNLVTQEEADRYRADHPTPDLP